MIFGDEFQFSRLIKSFIGNAYMYMYLPASKKNIEIVGEKRSLSYKNSYLNKFYPYLELSNISMIINHIFNKLKMCDPDLKCRKCRAKNTKVVNKAKTYLK